MITSTRRVVTTLFILGLVALAASAHPILSPCGNAACMASSALAVGSINDVESASLSSNFLWGVGLYLFWTTLLLLLILELSHPHFLKKHIKRARRRSR